VTLAEAQALLHEAITSPEPLPKARLEACFAGSDELPADERVAIYANMYLWRLVDALRETFPSLTRLLGDTEFAALAEDYVRRNPSRHHDIGRVGLALPAFLREFPDRDRPDLADLAELEWARHEVFSSPRADPLGPEALAELTPETVLEVSRALRVLRLDHAVAPLWRRIESGLAAEPPSPQSAALAVWRSGFEVFHSALSLDEAAAVASASSGGDLVSICAVFAGREDPAKAAHAALSSWFREGWIVGLARGTG
jgi:hypothetical protein